MATLEGIDQLDAKLKRLTLEVERKCLQRATKDGAEVIRAEMGRTAPKLTGHLSERIIISVVASESNAYYTLVRIGPARDAFYGQFDEFGTAHQTAEPFVHPSFENKKSEALEIAANNFREAVNSI